MPRCAEDPIKAFCDFKNSGNLYAYWGKTAEETVHKNFNFSLNKCIY